jgi:hypothetical protein
MNPVRPSPRPTSERIRTERANAFGLRIWDTNTIGFAKNRPSTYNSRLAKAFFRMIEIAPEEARQNIIEAVVSKTLSLM